MNRNNATGQDNHATRRRARAALAWVALLIACGPEPESSESLQEGLRSEQQYVVVLTSDASSDGVLGSAGLSRSRVRHHYRHALRGFSARLSAVERAGLLARTDVAYVEPDFTVQAAAEVQPGLARVGGTRNATARIDGVDQRVDVDIAVIDSGIDLDHPDLHVFRERNFLEPARSADDDSGHGTHVAGVAAALDNGAGVVGVAPGARLWSLKVLDAAGNGTLSNLLAAIDYVTANAEEIEVANVSLGGWGLSNAQREAVARSVAAGVVYVAAAGNDSTDIFGADGLPGSFPDFLPAALPEVMTVSASVETDGLPGGLGPTSEWGADDTLAPFSNFSDRNHPQNAVVSSGAKIDLAAPGAGVYSTLPGGTYGVMSGTSMATPSVAGAVGLYVAAFGRAHDAAGVLAIRQALVNAGEPQSGWRSGETADPDAYPERLLQVDRLVGTRRVFFDDFTGGLGKWTEAGEGDWNMEPLHAPAGYPALGSGSPAAHSDDCRTECSLTLAEPLDLRGLSSAALVLSRFVDAELDTGEYLRVEAWDGSAWNALRTWGGGAGDDDRWHSEFVELSGYVGRAGFRLRLVTRQNQTTEHVQVDDLQIVVTVDQNGTGSCGDQLCQEGETCAICAADCGACPAVCGNGSCEAEESCSTCIPDCEPCPEACGDGACQQSETCSTCSRDCGQCSPVCGDGVCQQSETCSTCSRDCGQCSPVCGDGACEPGESCTGCAADCGECTSVTTLFFDGFADLSHWTESGEGDWNTETLHGRAGYPGGASGSPAAHSDDCRNECTLTLGAAIDLRQCRTVRLELLRFLDAELDAGEFLRIDAWNGASWQTLAGWGGGNGDDDQWHAESISLSAFLNLHDFRLRIVTKQNQTTEHVHVDDLRLVGAGCD